MLTRPVNTLSCRALFSFSGNRNIKTPGLRLRLVVKDTWIVFPVEEILAADLNEHQEAGGLAELRDVLHHLQPGGGGGRDGGLPVQGDRRLQSAGGVDGRLQAEVFPEINDHVQRGLHPGVDLLQNCQKLSQLQFVCGF